MIVTTVEPTELEILDEIILFLDGQLDAFSSDRKKAKAYKEARLQYERVKAFRHLLEEGYPLIGLWVRKSNSKASQVVGQIAKIDKDNFWVKYWGSSTPYPESPGLLEIDEFAQATELKEGGFVRITEGHKTLKEGEMFQVMELQAKGWILTTDGKLISSEYWEVANDETTRSESTSSTDTEASGATEASVGVVTEAGESNIQLENRDLQANDEPLEVAGVKAVAAKVFTEIGFEYTGGHWFSDNAGVSWFGGSVEVKGVCVGICWNTNTGDVEIDPPHEDDDNSDEASEVRWIVEQYLNPIATVADAPGSVNDLPRLKCIIKQPRQPEVEGTILQDLGSNLLVAIAGFDEPVNTPKLWAYPVDSTLAEIAAIYGDSSEVISQEENEIEAAGFPQVFVPPLGDRPATWLRVVKFEDKEVFVDDPTDKDPRWHLADVELNAEAIALLNDEQLKTFLNTEGDLAFEAASEALQRARKAGVYLLEQKRRIKHGGWLPWLHENCPRISDRTAQVWMKIAKNWDEIRKNAASCGFALDALSIDGAMKLLKPAKSQDDVPPPEAEEEAEDVPENAEAETERDLIAFIDKSVSFSPNKINWALTNIAIQTRKQIKSLDEKELSILLENCEPLVEAARNELSQRQQKIAS